MENQSPADQAVHPWTSQSPLFRKPPSMTRHACSSDSSIHEWSSSPAVSTATAPSLLTQPFGFKVLISPGIFKVVTFIVARSSPLHSPIRRVNVSTVSSLANWSLNEITSSISISGVGLTSLLSLAFPSGSTWISKVESIVSILPAMSGSCTLVDSPSRPLYHCTIIPDLLASPSLLVVVNDVQRPETQFISSLCVLHHADPSTRSYALIRTTSTSSLWAGDQQPIYWNAISILRLSLTCMITWSFRLLVVMCATLWGSRSVLQCSGDMKMLVALQSMSACIRCNSPC